MFVSEKQYEYISIILMFFLPQDVSVAKTPYFLRSGKDPPALSELHFYCICSSVLEQAATQVGCESPKTAMVGRNTIVHIDMHVLNVLDMWMFQSGV